MKVTQGAPLSVNNQSMSFCIMQKDRGISCGTANTKSSTSASEFRTYWFPTSYVDKIKDDTPLDMWDATHNSYKISDYIYGLT